MSDAIMARIQALSCWQSKVRWELLLSGETSRNFDVQDRETRFVARVCEVRRLLGIDRRNEWLSQDASPNVDVAPEVLHAVDGILVSRFSRGRTCVQEDDGVRVQIETWEYAGGGNPLFGLTRITAFLYRVELSMMRFFRIQKTVSPLRERLREFVQTLNSSIDFDTSYAASHGEAYRQSRDRIADTDTTGGQ